MEGWAGGLCLFLVFLVFWFLGGGVRGRVVWDEGEREGGDKC